MKCRGRRLSCSLYNKAAICKCTSLTVRNACQLLWSTRLFFFFLSKQTSGVPDGGTKWHGCFHFYTAYLCLKTLHMIIFVLCQDVSVFLPILCLFVIKLVQACRARPPRAVTHTPSLPTKKSLVLIISILWAYLSAQNRHLNNPHPPQQPTNLTEALWKELWVDTLDGKKTC